MKPIQNNSRSSPIFRPISCLMVCIALLVSLTLSPFAGSSSPALAGGYSIQFGAYKSLSNAVEEVSKMAKAGRYAFLRHEPVEGRGDWYRVYIDKHDTEKGAEQVAKKLRQAKIISDYQIRPVGRKRENAFLDQVDGAKKYYLHLKSFLEKTNAQKEVQRLTKQGHKAYLATIEVPWGRWFKVCLGAFDDQKQAERAGSKLVEKGIIAFFKSKEIDRIKFPILPLPPPPPEIRNSFPDGPLPSPAGWAQSPSDSSVASLSPESEMEVLGGQFPGLRDESLESEIMTRGRAYYDFGIFAYEDGDYEDAEKNFKKALSFNPHSPQYNHYLGKTYLKMKGYQEAEKHLDLAWKRQSDLPDLKYDIALMSYKTNNFSRAADLFSEISDDHPSNVMAQYYAGINLFKLERYEKAVKYFENAARMSPNLKANGLYYAGISELKMGHLERAVERLEYVKDHAESKFLRDYALKWLDAVEKQKKALRPYSLFLNLGFQYDDNVRLEPLNKDLFADESDYVIEGYLSGKYDLFNRGAFKFGAGYSHFQNRHDDLHQYDLVGSIFHLYGKYLLKPFTFSFNYLPSYYWLDSHGFMFRHQFKPEVLWRVNKKLMTQFSYSYYRNTNFQDQGRDGHTNELFLNAFWSLNGKLGHLFGGLGFENNSASDPDQDYYQVKTKVGASLKIPWGVNLGLTGKFYEQNYDNVNSTFGIKREDAKYSGSISLSRNIFYDWLTVTGEFDFTKNDSNINDYKYKRKVTSLSFTGKF